MAAMLHNSVVAVVVMRTRPRAILLPYYYDNHEKINSWVSFSLYDYGALLAPQRFLRRRPLSDRIFLLARGILPSLISWW